MQQEMSLQRQCNQYEHDIRTSTENSERSINEIGELKLETTFRVLDEFDVYLDGPTRRLTIQMLIHMAHKAMSYRQFICITLLDISDITSDPRVKDTAYAIPQNPNVTKSLGTVTAIP